MVHRASRWRRSSGRPFATAFRTVSRCLFCDAPGWLGVASGTREEGWLQTNRGNLAPSGHCRPASERHKSHRSAATCAGAVSCYHAPALCDRTPRLRWPGAAFQGPEAVRMAPALSHGPDSGVPLLPTRRRSAERAALLTSQRICLLAAQGTN